METWETKPKVRTTEPFRAQGGVMRFEFAEDLIAPEHPARALWDVLGTLDLAPFTCSAKALEGRVGRPVHSVQMLLTLWLYADRDRPQPRAALRRSPGITASTA